MVGRKEESIIMKNLLESGQSEFLAMYGRRRVGKTYLIRQVYKPNIIFECSGIHQQNMGQQLENFWHQLMAANTAKKPPLPKTWLQAFSLLKTHIQQQKTARKKVIFFDEIAWFETPRSGFLAALDNFWNQFCTQRTDVVLVICGSAASWIIEKIINNKGGLHNRVTQHIQLMPFTLHETKAFLETKKVRLTHQDITTLYMAIGGIPYYLNYVRRGQSVALILDGLFFKPQAPLKNEFANLYASLFKNSQLHIAIVAALVKKNKGLTRNEISTATGIHSGGGLTLLLQELVACNFVKIIYPIHKAKEDALYRLVDAYSIFYFRFLAPAKGNHSWKQQLNTQAYKIWTGYAFENLCFQHLPSIKKVLGINGIITNEYSWIQKGNQAEKGAQIDLVIDRGDNCINLLELKYHHSIFKITKTYATQLQEKRMAFTKNIRTKKNVFTVLLTANGTEKNEYYLSVMDAELKLDDLFVE
jgi:predicted AAA+ superfamily ATPase